MLALSDTAGVSSSSWASCSSSPPGWPWSCAAVHTRAVAGHPAGHGAGAVRPALETPLLQKLQGWGVVLVAFFVVWLPYNWLIEPSTNLEQEQALRTQAIERGRGRSSCSARRTSSASVACDATVRSFAAA